ncbi:hypothetical protein [Microcoleus sp. S13_B4]|uniref:hypothetical protein n=1 Tax=Microcoleus sp. S13_B4 TaxID=3055408 RepID=UPI002FD0F32D
MNAEELADLEARERYILDQQGILRKGIEEGLAQGREEGREEGLGLGMREKAVEIAR